MKDFKWLHLSDMHFRTLERYSMSFVLERLTEKLKYLADQEKFKYIFITGDLANGYEYVSVEENVKKLLLDNDILEENGRIFWACGNHDIPRTNKYRNLVIQEIRDKQIKETDFEEAFANDESRQLLLAAFNNYNELNKKLFGTEQTDYPHYIFHMEDIEVIMLNTCLTSCDDNDEHKLFLCEHELNELFSKIENGKPVFVIGHHSIDFFEDNEKNRLLDLFLAHNVDMYLCGHSHRLEVKPLAINSNMMEIVSGGFKIDGYAVMSFIVGEFCGTNYEYNLTPYVFRESESREWVEDYQAIRNSIKGQKYKLVNEYIQCEEKISGIDIEIQKAVNTYINESGKDIIRINYLGEKLLLEYAKKLQGGENNGLINFADLCEVAITRGSHKINYTSLSLSESKKDIWDFCENARLVLDELKIRENVFGYLKTPALDFNEFYKAVDEFNTIDNTYILITDPVHDIDKMNKRILTSIGWNVILDYDGYSHEDGLRASAPQNIKDLNATYNVINDVVLRKEVISWIHFGENMKFSLNKDDLNLYSIKNMFRLLIEKLYVNWNGKIILVFNKDIEVYDKELMKIVWERFYPNAYFVFVGAYDADWLDRELSGIFLDLSGRKEKDCYSIIQTSKKQFFSKFAEYLKGEIKEKNIGKRLPTNNGIQKLEQSLYINLNDFFEVLTEDVGKDLSNHEKDLNDFYLGGEAEWDLFYAKDILNLFDDEYFEDRLNQIRTVLGVKQENPRNAIFYLLHQAGFGGTTMSRYIAWRLHNDYPVLVLKNYEYGKIKPIVQNLYDVHSRKGVLVIADESNFTISDLENLEREMYGVDRAFALLIVKRMRNNKESLNSKRTINLTILSDDCINNLKTKYKEKSSLETELLEKKNSEFNEVFKRESGMLCPFLIGLYYQDIKFTGVTEYVERIIRGVESIPELDLLIAMSVINYFGRIGVSKEMIRKYVPLHSNSDYLDKYSYAKEAFIGVYDKTVQMKLYHEKHPLISLELLNICVRKRYHCDYEEKLKDISEQLIDTILMINRRGITSYYKILLDKLFIYKNQTDVDDKGYTSVTDFSPLIMAIPMPASKESVMRKLANNILEIIDQIPVNGNELYYKTAAHICGHLGRLYKAYSQSINLLENKNESIFWCEKAEEIMRKADFRDPYIYHMHGTSLSQQCSDKINIANEEGLSDKELEELQDNIEEAVFQFDNAIFEGEVVRGGISKASLLIQYMKYLIKKNNIKGPDELKLLTPAQREYLKDISDIIDTFDELELDTKDRGRVNSLKNVYKSDIMFNDYGSAVKYYTDTIDDITKQKGEDAKELYVLRSSLASVIVGKYRQAGLNPYKDMELSDVELVLELLKKNIFSTTAFLSKWEMYKRSNDCHTWIKIAQMSSKSSIKTGIAVANRWLELQEELRIKDPRPYYYLAVLYYVDAMDGYVASLDMAKKNQKLAYNIANSNSSLRIVNVRKIRNILVKGKGMRRIHYVHDLSQITPDEKNNAVKLRGKFVDVNKTRIGILNVISPLELKNIDVYFKIGDQNSISANQTTHILEFCIGFTFERIEAINSTIKDITNCDTV